MDCSPADSSGNREFLHRLNQKAVELRIPLTGSIELTHRCNLRCLHCYLGDQDAIGRNRDKELHTDQWTRILDEITEAGCLYLLITGGEPLLRRDFATIYSHAKRRGLLVTIFTNGTGITGEVLDLFEDLPPHFVEISIYGATAATHEGITGVEGSYELCLKGIERLLASKIDLRLKTILMTRNSHEFHALEDMAKAHGVRFRFDAAIFPRLGGDKAPLRLRVPPREFVEKDLSDEERLKSWRDYFERARKYLVPDTLYNCGAGMTNFHIDPYGSLKPCLMVADIKYDLVQGSFSDGWRNVMPRIRAKKMSPGHDCYQCDKIMMCGYCQGFFQLENDTDEACSQYLCTVGRLRFQTISRDPAGRFSDLDTGYADIS